MIYSLKYSFSNASSYEDQYKKEKRKKKFFVFFPFLSFLKSVTQGSNIETFWFLSKLFFSHLLLASEYRHKFERPTDQCFHRHANFWSDTPCNSIAFIHASTLNSCDSVKDIIFLGFEVQPFESVWYSIFDGSRTVFVDASLCLMCQRGAMICHNSNLKIKLFVCQFALF